MKQITLDSYPRADTCLSRFFYHQTISANYYYFFFLQQTQMQSRRRTDAESRIRRRLDVFFHSLNNSLSGCRSIKPVSERQIHCTCRTYNERAVASVSGCTLLCQTRRVRRTVHRLKTRQKCFILPSIVPRHFTFKFYKGQVIIFFNPCNFYRAHTCGRTRTYIITLIQ